MSHGSAIPEAYRSGTGSADFNAEAAHAGVRNNLRTRSAAGLMAAAIFLLDAFTRDDLAVASLYVFVPLIAASNRGRGRRRLILTWSLSCVLLSVAGYAIFQARGAPPLAVAHLGISLTVLGVTTALLLRTNAMNVAVERGERRYRTIFDSLAVAIWEHDFSPVAARVRRLQDEGVTNLRRFLVDNPNFVVEMRRLVRITDVNATALKMMGVATKGQFFARLSDFLPETDESFAECILAINERRPLFQAETTVTPLGGGSRDIIVAFGLGAEADLARVPGSILDISGRKALEAQVVRSREELAHAQRHTALAAMSASIAHELNQPMSAVHSFADAARRWMARTPPDLSEASAALVGLVEAIGHARTVMERVRSLVGSSRLDTAEIDLRELLATAVLLMDRNATETRTRIEILDDDGATLLVRGDRVLLKQVFVNLIDNAVQAMRDVPAEARVVSIQAETVGGEVMVRVADRGPGWEKEADAKVFGSFYTTKDHGMGLGLSISRTTVERHGGSIALKSGTGGGAVVVVSLPLASEAGYRAVEGDLEDDALELLVQ
jgi:signal transduction histidine kinase